MRVKVMIDIAKPLRRGVMVAINAEKTSWIGLKYERLGEFCYFCGKLGHTDRDCIEQEREDGESALVFQYGPFLVSSPHQQTRFSLADKEKEKKWVENLVNKKRSQQVAVEGSNKMVLRAALVESLSKGKGIEEGQPDVRGSVSRESEEENRGTKHHLEVMEGDSSKKSWRRVEISRRKEGVVDYMDTSKSVIVPLASKEIGISNLEEGADLSSGEGKKQKLTMGEGCVVSEEVDIEMEKLAEALSRDRSEGSQGTTDSYSCNMESSQSKRSASFSEQTSQPLSEKDMEELQSTLPPDKKLKAGREYIWNRKSKRKAEYWKYYLEYVENGKLRAECKFCPKTFAADGNLNGSKNVKNHAESCLGNPINLEKEKGKEKQTKLYFDQEHESSELKCGSRIINLNDVREALIHMIIVDELPFKHVEKPGFRHFVQVACPQFHIPSRVTIARDCLKLYYSEKEKLREMFKTCQRISVTTDTWTSIQIINYMCLTAHFIDNDWKLNKKIINFCPISSHKGEAIGKAFEACLEYWGIDDKLFTVTVDNASSNDVACAHLSRMNSPARILRFKDLVQKANIDSKSSLSFDVPTRWNSTYIMLETALKFRRVFSGLSLPDGEDLNDNERPPEPEDWEKMERLVLFLEGFYLLTKRISCSHYVTANKGLGEIASMYDMLNNWEQSEDLNFQAMAIAMKKKFDKYWGDVDKMNKFIYVALLLDPHSKMVIVELTLTDMHGPEKGTKLANDVKEFAYSLFEEYRKMYATSNIPDCGDNMSMDIDNRYLFIL
uniref:CCHC-type domain-containing protein n=1 Tax=Chenopodium quinoa TaxID=63459 RepID=A0A803MKJ2_CHEQI